MPFRFRKSVKILPGLRLNFSKSGVSTSIGGPGASSNSCRRGTRGTVGLPGSGLSFSSQIGGGGNSSGNQPPSGVGPRPASKGRGCGAVALVMLALVGVSQCVATMAPQPAAIGTARLSPPTGAALDYSDGDTVHVTASSLRTRSEPSADGAVTGSLKAGESAKIVQRSGEWLQVAQGAALVWIAAKHVSSGPTRQPQQLLASPATDRPGRVRSEAEPAGHSRFGRACKKGKPCGNACISKDRVCHK